MGLIVDGLKRLEYRGYDSAGVAVLGPEGLEVRRAAGRIKVLEGLLRERPLHGHAGVGHTRWATHGRPTDDNAHPHTDGSGELVVVHNGIIENYLPIKERLASEGHVFRSETDTEVIAHLIERHLRDVPRLEEAVKRALRELRGSYAVAVLHARTPDRIVAAKHGAGSVVVGLGQDETFLGSDIPAILPHTRDMVILEDHDVAVITRSGVEVSDLDGAPVSRTPTRILWDPILAEKGGYRHFMLKEIYEQPRAAADTLRGRVVPEGGSVVLPDISLDPEIVAGLQRVVLVACGTSYHAAIVGRFLLERLAGIAAEVDVASEFRYRDAVLGPETLVIALSQSGETADTLGAVRAARLKGAPIIAITNVVGSALAREATGTSIPTPAPRSASPRPRPSPRPRSPATWSPSGSGGGAARSRRRRGASTSRDSSSCLGSWSRRSSRSRRWPPSPARWRSTTTSSSSAAAFTTPWLWRGRSSSRSCRTSTPRGIRPER